MVTDRKELLTVVDSQGNVLGVVAQSTPLGATKPQYRFLSRCRFKDGKTFADSPEKTLPLWVSMLKGSFTEQQAIR